MLRLTALGGCALAVLATAAALGGHAVTASGQASYPFRVTSSLDGASVLPHRIHWIARTTLPASQVDAVSFLIDGKLRWIEHNPPYTYAGLENDAYLVTSWLTAGTHRFVVVLSTHTGRSASDSVVARVVTTPNPPSALAGTWQRTIDRSGAPAAGSGGNPTNSVINSGVYRMTFEKRWVRDQQPGTFAFPQSNNSGDGLYYLDDYTAGAHQVHVAGEVVFHPYSDRLPEGGAWCYVSGPPATYSWRVTGDTLTLKPVGGHDACGIRGYVWTGTWRRAG